MATIKISKEHLRVTIEAMRILTEFLEHEAAALARLDSDEARKLAQHRLEDAEVAEMLLNFYLDLSDCTD